MTNNTSIQKLRQVLNANYDACRITKDGEIHVKINRWDHPHQRYLWCETDKDYQWIYLGHIRHIDQIISDHQ